MKLLRRFAPALLILALGHPATDALAASAPPATITQARARLAGKWGVKMAAGKTLNEYIWEITGDGLLYDITEAGTRKMVGEVELLSPGRLILTMTREDELPYTLLMSVEFDDAITIGSRTNPLVFKLGAPPSAETQQAMNSVARTEREKRLITNNLRQLAAAADQYYLENGVSITSYDKLVGRDKYVKVVTPAAGEDYSRTVFQQGATLYVKTKDGRVFSYDP